MNHAVSSTRALLMLAACLLTGCSPAGEDSHKTPGNGGGSAGLGGAGGASGGGASGGTLGGGGEGGSSGSVASGDRKASAGLYVLWHSPTDMANLGQLPVVKGGHPRATIPTFVSDGNYADSASYETFQIDGHYDELDKVSKFGHLQIGDKKDPAWQKWFWYAENAQALGAGKYETPNWIGAWWDGGPGTDAIRGIHDLSFWYWDNVLTPAQRERTVGIRVNVLAQGNEGDDPGNTLSDTNHAAYVKGAQASAKRPPSFTPELGDEIIVGNYTRLLDRAFPSSDADEPLYPLFFRPREADRDAAFGDRLRKLWLADKVGLIITNADHEPSASSLQQHTTLREMCREGGNTRGFTESYGTKPDHPRVEGNFSLLQAKYWEALFALHVGATWIGMYSGYLADGAELVDNYNAPGTIGDEWRATFDFVAKYAGYQQHPAASPGGWVALRVGNRFKGNYDFLARQIVSGDGAMGTELYAGSTGTSFDFPSSDYVGPPSSKLDNGTNLGTGNRQSIWARQLESGQHLKIALNAELASALSGHDLLVRVHYLDDSPGAKFAVSAFGGLVGTIDVQNTKNWKTAEWTVPAAAIEHDADGAHVIVTPSAGTVRFHMVEVTLPDN